MEHKKTGQKGNTAKLLRYDMVRRFLLQIYVNILPKKKNKTLRKKNYDFCAIVSCLEAFFSTSDFFSVPFRLICLLHSQKKCAIYRCCCRWCCWCFARFWSKWSKPNLNGHGSYSLLSKHHIDTQVQFEWRRNHSRNQTITDTQNKEIMKSRLATLLSVLRKKRCVKFMITWKQRELTS